MKSCNRNEPKQYTNSREIIAMSNSTKEHPDNSGNHADLWPLKISLTTWSNGYSFLLITQHEMPFINKSEVTKRPKDRKINGKCTNGTNRRSRVWPVCFIYIRDERNDLERTSFADAKTSWYFAFSMSSKRLSASDTAVSPIKDTFAIWYCTMLFNEQCPPNYLAVFLQGYRGRLKHFLPWF